MLLGAPPTPFLVSVSITSDPTALTNALIASNSGLTVVGSTFTGPDGCAAIFSNGQSAASMLPNEGVVLSSGGPESLNLQDSDSQTTCYGFPGDPDLNSIARASTQDACILEIQFTVDPGVLAIEFQYVFGSDEYQEYVDSQYNDAFALKLNGVNLALIPASSIPVSINTVNQVVNTEFYIANDPSVLNPVPYPNFEADGFTKEFTATGLVSAGTNTLKLAIADASDCLLDSWVLLKGKSLKTDRVGGMEGASIITCCMSCCRCPCRFHCLHRTRSPQECVPAS